MSYEQKDASNHQELAEPVAGIWIALISLPLGAGFASHAVLLTWTLFRELYCRAYHASAPALCVYISGDFRPDLVLILLASLTVYVPVHLIWFRRLTRRSHFRTIILLGVILALIWLASKALPGEYEA